MSEWPAERREKSEQFSKTLNLDEMQYVGAKLMGSECVSLEKVDEGKHVDLMYVVQPLTKTFRRWYEPGLIFSTGVVESELANRSIYSGSQTKWNLSLALQCRGLFFVRTRCLGGKYCPLLSPEYNECIAGCDAPICSSENKHSHPKYSTFVYRWQRHWGSIHDARTRESPLSGAIRTHAYIQHRSVANLWDPSGHA